MSEWNECKLYDVAEVQNGYAFKSKDFLDNNGIPVVKIKNVASGKLSMIEVKFYQKPIDDLEKFVIKRNDILIAMTGSHINQPSSIVGKVSRYNLGTIALLNQRVGKIYPLDDNVLNEDFLFYFFKQDDVTYELALNAGGSANQANISPTLIKSLDFLLPPLPEQKAIASVISSLDDKIDLLGRQNKTLDSFAETLFRQWFIEEALEDWEEKPLDRVADYLNGLACQKYPPKNDIDKLPVLKIKELRNGFTDNSDWAAPDVPSEYLVESGDVIFSWSGSLLVKIWDGETCVLNQHLFKVTSDGYPKWFYYYWTKYHLDKFISIAESKATTMGHIKRKDLSHSMVRVPTEQELGNMNAIVCPLIEKIVLNNEQLINLEKLRDTLLPKLMSGEVRVEYESQGTVTNGKTEKNN